MPTSPRPFNPARYTSPPAGVRVDTYPPAALPDGEYSRNRMRRAENEAKRIGATEPDRTQRRFETTGLRHPQEVGFVRGYAALDAWWREVEEARLEFNQRTLRLGDNWERLRDLAAKLDRDLKNFNLERQSFNLEKGALEQERRAFDLEKEGLEQERQAFKLDKEALEQERQAFDLGKQALEHERHAFEMQKAAFFLGRDESAGEKEQKPPTE